MRPSAGPPCSGSTTPTSPRPSTAWRASPPGASGKRGGARAAPHPSSRPLLPLRPRTPARCPSQTPVRRLLSHIPSPTPRRPLLRALGYLHSPISSTPHARTSAMPQAHCTHRPDKIGPVLIFTYTATPSPRSRHHTHTHTHITHTHTHTLPPLRHSPHSPHHTHTCTTTHPSLPLARPSRELVARDGRVLSPLLYRYHHLPRCG